MLLLLVLSDLVSHCDAVHSAPSVLRSGNCLVGGGARYTVAIGDLDRAADGATIVAARIGTGG